MGWSGNYEGGGVIVLHISRIGLTPLPPSAKSPTMKWTTMKCTHYEITDPAWRLDPPPSLRTMKSIHCKSPLWEFCKGGCTINTLYGKSAKGDTLQMTLAFVCKGKYTANPLVDFLQMGKHCKSHAWNFCKEEYTANPLCGDFAKGNTLQIPLVFPCKGE